MLLRTNRFFILCIDFVVTFLFSIPILIDRFSRRGRSFVPKNILIIELWGIGDLVMMSSVLEPLKSKLPKSRISLLCRGKKSLILKNHPCVDEVITFDAPWTLFSGKYRLWRWNWADIWNILKLLKAKDFDLSLSARGDLRDNVLAFLSGAKKRAGYSWLGGRFFLTDSFDNGYKVKHRIQAWLNIISFLGINVQSSQPFITLSQEEKDISEKFLLNNAIGIQDLVIGIHPGAGIKNRCWSLGKFAQLAQYIRDSYGAKIIVFVEPDGYGNDIPIKGEFIKATFSLRELVAVVKKLNLFICNDSGAMHIASAMGVPIVAIFGPGDSAIVGPCGDGNNIIVRKNVDCRPCFDNCKYDDFRCLRDIVVEDVSKVVDEMFLECLGQAR